MLVLPEQKSGAPECATKEVNVQCWDGRDTAATALCPSLLVTASLTMAVPPPAFLP
jgi:hypothetical protein